MKTKKYSKLKIIGTYKNVNWQELHGFFKNLYNPLSLREFRGYAEDILIDDYATRHWSADKEKKGFGELITLNAEKSWRRFNIKFYDRSDNDRFISLEIDCINKKIIFNCSLDNREKLINAWEKISEIFKSFKILKRDGILSRNPLWDWIFKKKWWILFILFICAIFYKQLDWEKISDPKYWINEKFNLPFKGQESSQENSESLNQEIKDKIEDSKQVIIKELKDLYSRLKNEGEFVDGNVNETAIRTYERAKNFNANLIVKKGYEKEGGFGTWFTPMWDISPNQKFYLVDFVGDLRKNRISVFITKESALICQILTSDGRNEKISVDISSWIKGKPYLIIIQWKTVENRVELYVNKEKYEINIPELNFDKLGPILFIGIDFEGKYPARLKRGGPKISEGLKAIGLEEFKPANN